MAHMVVGQRYLPHHLEKAERQMLNTTDILEAFAIATDNVYSNFYATQAINHLLNKFDARDIADKLIDLAENRRAEAVSYHALLSALRVLAARKALNVEQEIKLCRFSIIAADWNGTDEVYDTLHLLAIPALVAMMHLLLDSNIHDHNWLAFAAAAYLTKFDYGMAPEDFDRLLKIADKEPDELRKQQMEEVLSRWK